MKLCFPISHTRHVTIIIAYAPTLTSTDDNKEAFYESLDFLLQSTPASDKLIVLGDFNARIGRKCDCWEGVIGPHGLGKMNNNGLLLLTLCAENAPAITNTLFRLASKYKTTRTHPRSKQWHLIDYVIVRQRDIYEVRITRAMRGAECWTDHQLVRSVLNLHIAPAHRKRPKLTRPSFNLAKLKRPDVREDFKSHLDDLLTAHGPLNDNPTEMWNQFKGMVTEPAKDVLGPKQRVHQDWFDENNEELNKILEQKRSTFIDINSMPKKDRFKHP